MVEGDWPVNRAAFAIHSRARRPDPTWWPPRTPTPCSGRSLHPGSSLARSPRTPAPSDDQAVFDDYTGVVEDPAEGDRIAVALGRRKLAILRNHGLLTVGTTVDAAAWWFITADRSCQAELWPGRGHPTEIDPATAALTHSQVGSDAVGRSASTPYCWIVAEEPGSPRLRQPY